MSPSISARLLRTQSDARLVAFARTGHERAFEALVLRYRGPLLGYCRRLLLSDERAEDALQQALMQAWLALRADTEVQNARAWLYRIVHNAALNALRVSGYDYCTLSESLSGADAPQEDLDRRIAVREALAGLAALPEMQREALLRTAVEGSSHRETARELGVSETALRGLVYRARTALRAGIGAIVPAPIVSWALSAEGGAPVGTGLTEVGVGGGAGVAGMLMKGSAMVATAGMLAGSIAAVHTRPRHVENRLRASTWGAHRRARSGLRRPVFSASTRVTRLTPQLATTHMKSSAFIPPPVHHWMKPKVSPRRIASERHGDAPFTAIASKTRSPEPNPGGGVDAQRIDMRKDNHHGDRGGKLDTSGDTQARQVDGVSGEMASKDGMQVNGGEHRDTSGGSRPRHDRSSSLNGRRQGAPSTTRQPEGSGKSSASQGGRGERSAETRGGGQSSGDRGSHGTKNTGVSRMNEGVKSGSRKEG